MKIVSAESRVKDFAHLLIESKWFIRLITLFIILLFFIVIPDMAGFFDKVFPENWHSMKMLLFWGTFPIVLLFIGGIFFILFAEFVVWLNRFSDGHAIGALGVIITILGLFGEAYQVITILFGG